MRGTREMFAERMRAMKTVDGKIVEITENELYSLYLTSEMDYVMSFRDFKARFEAGGCTVHEAGDPA